LKKESVIRIATRASQLALWQSRFVASKLIALNPDLRIEFIEITTEGDRVLDMSLSKIGGKGLFIKELEVALLESRADLAVHSMKDLPNAISPEFCIASILGREDARDVLVTSNGYDLTTLPAGATVGTSSLRRRSQILALRRDLNIRDLRGNVTTRLEKQQSGQYDAIVLAAAGLKRLGLISEKCAYLGLDELVPAVGQGAIGVEVCTARTDVQSLVAPLNCESSANCVKAERSMNKILNGSCQVPIGGHAVIKNDKLVLTGVVASIDGQLLINRRLAAPKSDAERLGETLANRLIEAGADKILSAV
jgi:hydroxymethylbilane synthase